MILYPLFFIISIFIPRDKNLWVFGCFKGYKDNTKSFFEYAAEKKEYRCVWLANNETERDCIISLGFEAVKKKSYIGYFISSRAAITYICTGFSDVNRFLALRSKVINFWHGTPIKKVYLDSEHDLSRFGDGFLAKWFAKTMMVLLNKNIDFYYASNSFERKIVSSAAGIEYYKSIALGAPRFDDIRIVNNSEIVLKLKSTFKKIILFAPTWRENGVWPDECFLSEGNLKKLNNYLLGEDVLFLVKPHPLSSKKEFLELGLLPNKNIIYADDIGLNDINQIYGFSDILVTDVSSSIFDYLIFDKPVVIFMPDLERYISGNRGVYEYFEEILRANALLHWSELIDGLQGSMSSSPVEFLEILNEVKALKGVKESIYKDICKRFN